MKEKMKKRFASVVAFGLLAGMIVAIVAVIAYFGGAIMKIFGFEYESPGSIVFFFLIAAVAGFPSEIIAKALPKALLTLGKMTPRGAKVLFVILDTVVTAVTMAIVDYFMDSVSATDLSILVISLLFSLLSLNDLDKKK